MSEANSGQVGGSHYACPLQHWDFVEDFSIPYLEAQIIKYITRSRKKDGYKDLGKAKHNTIKLSERVTNNGRKPLVFVGDIYVEMYAGHNGLQEDEKLLVQYTLNWRSYDNLKRLVEMIDRLCVDLYGVPAPLPERRKVA